MKKSEGQFLLGLAVVAISLLMLRNPNCRAGCRTVFDHLLSHELEFLL